MTAYEFFVPVIALALAGAGLAYVHFTSKRLDQQAKQKHPAE